MTYQLPSAPIEGIYGRNPEVWAACSKVDWDDESWAGKYSRAGDVLIEGISRLWRGTDLDDWQNWTSGRMGAT